MVTYVDVNRICGNLNYLLGTNTLPENRTADDYLYKSGWYAIRDAVEDVYEIIGVTPELPDDETSSYNFNLIESFCETAKPIVDELRAQRYANKYVGDGWRVGSEIFVGGFE